jgi:hypothetical protein
MADFNPLTPQHLERAAFGCQQCTEALQYADRCEQAGVSPEMIAAFREAVEQFRRSFEAVTAAFGPNTLAAAVAGRTEET